MKITEIRLGLISVPLRVPFKTALRSVDSVEDVIVEIHTDNGAVGYGEAPPTGVITGDTTGAIIGAIQDHMVKTLVGRDVDDFEDIMIALQGCILKNTSAKAAVDMALWDLYGQLYKIPVYKLMGAGNKLNPAEFEVADIYKTSVCPLAKVMRRELKKRNVKHLKVVYSKEKPVRPIEDMGISCRTNCICPPGAAHKCTERRDIPGSTAFVPSVVGLIIASEVIKDITHDAMVKTRHENGVDIEG